MTGPAARAAGALAGVLAACLLAAPVRADGDHDTARALREAGTIIPFEEVLAAARKLHDGRLLEVELEQEEGGEGYVYEVEIVDPEGVVWRMFFDARTGERIEGMEDDD